MTVDEEGDEVPMEVQQEAGHKMLTPFIVKATLTLANHHKVALTNPEKHAQPSLTEAVDHMTDVLRHSLREEKSRMISSKRKAQKNALADDLDGMLDDDYNLAVSNDMAESSPEENARMEALPGPKHTRERERESAWRAVFSRKWSAMGALRDAPSARRGTSASRLRPRQCRHLQLFLRLSRHRGEGKEGGEQLCPGAFTIRLSQLFGIDPSP